MNIDNINIYFKRKLIQYKVMNNNEQRKFQIRKTC